ncbi:hypothetical protein BH18ACI5_BH18ACI5_06860 [soil metagenome]
MPFQPGNRLGPYEIKATLGAGGMGEVYRARDTKLNRDVAIKLLLNSHDADPVASQRFQREAQAVAALNHPSIVTIYAIEEFYGRAFRAMELVEGRTLAEVISPAGLPLPTVIDYGLQLADALSAAHTQGITHRDLKPANVMQTSNGRLKILDFGLAKLRDEVGPQENTVASPTFTGAGQIVGTVAYMSPEQASSANLDHRTDLFSLGVMLYELSTGQRPFKGDSSVSLLAAVLKDTPQSVTELKPGLPREFARIVRRALAKDPEHRYQSAKDLRNDLQDLKAELGSGALSPGAAAGLSPQRSPRTKLIAVGAAAAVFAVVAAGYVLWPRPKPASPRSMSLSRLTSSWHASLAAISSDGKYVVHVVTDRQHSLWVRQAATGSNVQIVPPGDDRFIGLTFSPDANHVYYTRLEGRSTSNVYRIPILGGTPEPVVRDVDSAITFSPDGVQIAFLRGVPRQRQLLVMAADRRGQPRTLLSTGFDDLQLYSSIAWSPDGRTIAVPLGGVGALGNAKSATIGFVDVATGDVRRLPTSEWISINAVSYIGDSTLVASAIEAGKLNNQLWIVDDSQLLRRLTNDLND